jgi:hypothetical protein
MKRIFALVALIIALAAFGVGTASAKEYNFSPGYHYLQMYSEHNPGGYLYYFPQGLVFEVDEFTHPALREKRIGDGEIGYYAQWHGITTVAGSYNERVRIYDPRTMIPQEFWNPAYGGTPVGGGYAATPSYQYNGGTLYAPGGQQYQYYDPNFNDMDRVILFLDQAHEILRGADRIQHDFDRLFNRHGGHRRHK